MSPLNPSTAKPTVCQITSTTVSTRKHLSNLDKLLLKEPPPAPELPRQEADGGILQKLARFWPEMKAAEEMSPRNLVRLQRLLSKTAEYSPRNNLGGRWKEYHGSKDWVGLVDPLDENLRREVVRYGEFVQAGYHAFHVDPEMPTCHAPSPNHVSVPDRSYKVTRSLYATSSIALPGLMNKMAPGWMTQKSSWIGYVAVCDDSREIQRMGRRDIVIALRGTATCLEWAENMRTQLVKIPNPSNSDSTRAKVESGFLSLYKTRGTHVPSLSESVVEEVKRLMELYKGEELSITITGHSLGAALALLVADELSVCSTGVPPIAVFSFGGPRVGNAGFADRVKARNVKVLRIVNNQDLITRVPGMLIEGLEEKLRDTRIEGTWDYSHVGTELRVDSRMSPYLKPGADIACCHDLEAYLHLVDGFLASDCPFRSSAKRSLVKLVNEQSSNVKKLYTSKAKAMTLSIHREERFPLSSCLPSPS